MKRKKLNLGDIAPQFRTTDVLGNVVDLAVYKDKFVLLAFLRFSGCPFCNLTIHRLSMEYSMLTKNGCQVIAIVQSAGDGIKKNIYDRHKVRPPYPIIADPDRALCDLYGVRESKLAAVWSIKDIPYWIEAVYGHGFRQAEIDGSLLLVPALFLVGPGDQKIVRAGYGSSFYDHATFTSIYESLIFERM